MSTLLLQQPGALARWSIASLALAVLARPAHADAPESTHWRLAQSTTGGAAHSATSDSWRLDATLSQKSTAGNAASSGFLLQSGFWTSGSLSATLQVQADGSGAGSASGVGIACSADAGGVTGDCDELVQHGQGRSLVASPQAGSAFDGWTGCDSTGSTVLPGDTCQILLTSSHVVSMRFTALGSIGDSVWRDLNGDGAQGVGEPGIDGVTVMLSGSSGSLQTTTANGGLYRFADLYPGNYTVSIATGSLPPGVTPSHDLDGVATPHTATLTLADGQHRDDVDFGYQPLADLRVLKTDQQDPLPGGADLQWTISVHNAGPAPATEVLLRDVLPAGTTLVSTEGCSNDPVGLPDCALGTLAIGQTVTVDVRASVQPAPPPAIVNTATVSALEADPDPSNNSDSETTTLDARPPRVLSVRSIAATEDGVLDDCETVHGRRISALQVRFDEALDYVDDTDGWRLRAPGADGVFATSGCAGASGDDQIIELLGIQWQESSTTAVLTLRETLSPALYRLHACGSGSAPLRDLAGNPLDGNGDGEGGDDFMRRFRADPGNLLANGHFDCSLSGWTVIEQSPGQVQHTDDDVEASPHSGAAAIAAGSLDPALAQCVPVQPDTLHAMSARVALQSSDAGAVVSLVCSRLQGVDCGGMEIGSPVVAATFVGDTAGSSLTLNAEVPVPSGAGSLLCSVEFRGPGGSQYQATLDQVRLSGGDDGTPAPGVIFADGFEPLGAPRSVRIELE